MKKFAAIVLALCMVFALASCGSSKTEEVSYDIGYNTWGSGSAVFDIMNNIAVQALDIFGSNGTRAIDNNQADTELQNIENFISAGVDGIIMQATATTILPQAASECESAQIPFVLSTFPGEDSDRAEISATNEYYVGSVSADMYAEGYLIGQMAAADGMKTAVLVGGNVGDNLFEQRIEGFTQAFVVEGGGEILDSARCTSPAECQEKASALLSAYSDTDMIYAMVGDYSVGCISAMNTLGLSIPVYVTNADTNCIEYIRDGTIAGATSGNELVGAVAAALLINYLDGHPIVDEDGNAPELVMTGFEVNTENLDDFETLFGDSDGPYTADALQTLLYRYNEDVSYDTFVDFVDNHLNLTALMADRG